VGGVEVVGQSGIVPNGGDPKGSSACPPGGDPHGGGGTCPLGGDPHGGGGDQNSIGGCGGHVGGAPAVEDPPHYIEDVWLL
jgi:hypothetical protein